MGGPSRPTGRSNGSAADLSAQFQRMAKIPNSSPSQKQDETSLHTGEEAEDG
jgi:hypothetical protein